MGDMQETFKYQIGDDVVILPGTNGIVRSTGEDRWGLKYEVDTAQDITWYRPSVLLPLTKTSTND